MKLHAFAISLALIASVAGFEPAYSVPSKRSNQEANAPRRQGSNVTFVAATVDGHPIPMNEILVKSVLLNRDQVLNGMISAFVVHREAKRRGLEATDAQIDARIAVYRKSIAPSTVAVELKKHHTSMGEFREMFRVALERDAIAAASIQPSPMIHCRQILLRCTADGQPKSETGPKYTPDEARSLLLDLVNKMSMGADFEALAAQYGEPGTADLGVLYNQSIADIDSAALDAGMQLKKGELTPQPIRARDGYCLIQAVSTGADHPKSEDKLYADADAQYRKTQIMFLAPEIVSRLIERSKITYAKDSDIVLGKPLPANAAVIDGHPIPMSEVAPQCVNEYGHVALDVAIENYVVDRESKRRGITVSESEIDQKVDYLRKAIAPHTIDEGLVAHHTTMADLREDFRQMIEREKLVIAGVIPPPMVHAEVIFLKSDQPATSDGAQTTNYSADTARDRLTAMRTQIDQGASFDDLAKQNSQMFADGDAGILYLGASNIDTAVLDTALKMKTGDITPEPIQTYGGYFLLRAVSTSASHPASEDAAYTSAVDAYKLTQADLIAPQYVSDLVAKAKVVKYLP